MSPKKKRFIAGATCPKCKSMDSLYVYYENNIEMLACTRCDYSQSQTDEATAKASKNESGVIGVFKP